MAIGLTGRTGATVLSLVAVECRIDRELVPIPHRLLEESRALERETKRERATRMLAQSMGTGPTGTNGVTVLSVVVAECRNDQGPVAILRRRLVESHALGGVWNPDNAMQSLVQSTETGQTGVRGVHAQSHVVGGLSSILAVVIIPLPLLEDLYVSEKARNQGLATLTTVEHQL